MPTVLQDRRHAMPRLRGGPLSLQRPPTLLEVEEQRQRDLFTGREHELAQLRRALEGSGAHVFHVHGPDGIGKTSLLQAFAAEARRRSISTLRIDARDLEPTLPSVLAALEAAGLSVAEREKDEVTRVVLLDSYEQMRAIEPLVLRELLRRVRRTTVVVIAGRTPPSAEWRALSLWGDAIVPMALRNLEPADATSYLEGRGIRGQAAASICAFSHGHPLALALAADAWQGAPDEPFAPETAPEVISSLYEYFMRGVSGPEHRAALEVAAIVHTTSEAILGRVLECDAADAADAFARLRDLGFVQMGNRGVFPHDLAREVILAELRWRNPQRLAELALRAVRYYTELIRTGAAAETTRDDTEGRMYEVTIEDHRGLSGAEWFGAMNERMAAGDRGRTMAPRSESSPVAALGHEEFGKQLRSALRALDDLVVLETNPLIHAHAVRARAGGAAGRERAAALRTLLCEEAETLRGTARGDTWYLVLSAAYLNNPGRTKHEIVAEELGMSYSTFRRYLAAATQRLIAALWERELGRPG